MKKIYTLVALLSINTLSIHSAEKLLLTQDEQKLFSTVLQTIKGNRNRGPEQLAPALEALMTPKNKLAMAGILTQLPADSQEHKTLENLLVKNLETIPASIISEHPVVSKPVVYDCEYIELLKTFFENTINARYFYTPLQKKGLSILLEIINTQEQQAKEGFWHNPQPSPFFSGVSLEEVIAQKNKGKDAPTYQYSPYTVYGHKHRLEITTGKAYITSLNGMHTVPFAGSIEEIDLHYPSITQLPAACLAACKQLKKLNFEHGIVRQIHPYAFAGLKQLSELNLNTNKITQLSPYSFTELEQLHSLNLRCNKIVKINPLCFDGLKSLKILDLNENKITTLPDGLFDTLHNLEKLDIQKNPIKTIGAHVFDPLTNLKNLHFDGKGLSELPTSIFNELHNLEELWTSFPAGTNLSADLLKNLHNLKSLCISKSKLGAIDPHAFDGCKNLTSELSLRSCAIKALPPELFHKQSTLTSLFIVDNPLEELPEQIFNGLNKIDKIVLNNNQIKNLPDNLFNNLKNLTCLCLRGNKIESLPEQLCDDLENMQRIYLSNNKLSSISADRFKNLPNLTDIDLTENPIPQEQIDALKKALPNVKITF